MSDGGYIKLWRRLLDWPPYRDGNNDFRAVVVTLMLRATWRDEQRWVGGKTLTVPRGSVLIPRRELAQLCANDGVPLSDQRIRTIEAQLESDHGCSGTNDKFLTRKVTPAGTLYSIVKYDFYQGDDCPSNTPSNTRATPEQHPSNTPLYKKDQEGEELHAPASPSKPSGRDRSTSRDRSPSPAKKQSPLEQAITDLCEAWPRLVAEELGVRGAPVPAGKLRSLARDLLDGDPGKLEAAKDLCRAFLRLDDEWLAERGYQFRDIRHRLVKLKRDQQGGDRGSEYPEGYRPPVDEVAR